MPYRIAQEDGIARLTYEGRVTQPEVRDAARDALALVAAGDARAILIDTRLVEASPGYADLYQVANEALLAARGVRQALVGPAHGAGGEAGYFWQLVCSNRGLPVRTFLTEEEALAWLAQEG